MKKILIVALAFLGFSLTTVAQTDSKKAVKKTEKSTKVVEKKGNTVLPVTAKAGVVLKKDGTPDKRYKNS